METKKSEKREEKIQCSDPKKGCSTQTAKPATKTEKKK